MRALTALRPTLPNSVRPLALLAGIATLFVLREAADVIVPFALAILFSFLLSPIADRLERWRLGRLPSVLIVVVFAGALAAATGYLVTTQLLDVASQLPRYRTNIERKVNALRGLRANSIGKATETVQELNHQLTEEASKPPGAPPSAPPVPVVAVNQPSDAVEALRKFLGPLVAPVLKVAIVVALTFFLLVDRKEVRNRLLRLAGRRHISSTTQAIDDASSRVSRYLLAQFLVNSSYGTAVALGLYFIGVPNALLWGVLAGLLRFIPYLGPLVGAAGPAVLAVAVFPGWTQPLETLGLFLALELVTANFVEPFLYATHTGIAPLGVIVAAVFWTTLWGPAGLFLSMPLTLCVLVVAQHIPGLNFLSIALGDQPALPAYMQFYQRALARDSVELESIVQHYLETNSVRDLYEVVMVPALQYTALDKQRSSLDAGAVTFIVDTAREMIAAFEKKETAAVEPGAQAPADPPRILCMPARDRLDEVASLALAHLARAAGYRIETLSAWAFSGEKIESIAQDRPDLVCMIAVSPRSVLYLRGLCKKVRQHFPGLKIVAGVWTRQEDAHLTHPQVAGCASRVAFTVNETVEAVRELALLAPAAPPAEDAPPLQTLRQ